MTRLEQLAQQRTDDVISTAIAFTIEKIAAEAARDLLRDPVFKAELKAIARTSIGRAFRDLRTTTRRPTRTK